MAARPGKGKGSVARQRAGGSLAPRSTIGSMAGESPKEALAAYENHAEDGGVIASPPDGGDTEHGEASSSGEVLRQSSAQLMDDTEYTDEVENEFVRSRMENVARVASSQQVNIRFGEGAWTDLDGTVQVDPNSHFVLERGADPAERVLLMRGQLEHEVCHELYFDRSAFEELKTEAKSDPSKRSMMKLANIMADGHDEWRHKQAYPEAYELIEAQDALWVEKNGSGRWRFDPANDSTRQQVEGAMLYRGLPNFQVDESKLSPEALDVYRECSPHVDRAIKGDSRDVIDSAREVNGIFERRGLNAQPDTDSHMPNTGGGALGGDPESGADDSPMQPGDASDYDAKNSSSQGSGSGEEDSGEQGDDGDQRSGEEKTAAATKASADARRGTGEQEDGSEGSSSGGSSGEEAESGSSGEGSGQEGDGESGDEEGSGSSGGGSGEDTEGGRDNGSGQSSSGGQDSSESNATDEENGSASSGTESGASNDPGSNEASSSSGNETPSSSSNAPSADESPTGEGEGEDAGSTNEAGGSSPGGGAKAGDEQVDANKRTEDAPDSGGESSTSSPLVNGTAAREALEDRREESRNWSSSAKAAAPQKPQYKRNAERVRRSRSEISKPHEDQRRLWSANQHNAKKFAKSIADARVEVQRDKRHQKRGKLDRRKVRSIATGEDDVFVKKGRRQEVDMSVELVLDISGSMKFSGSEPALRNSAATTSQGLDIAEIPHEVRGFGEQEQQPLYRGYGEKPDWRLGAIEANGSMTCLGAAMPSVRGALLERKEQSKLAVLFTDGQADDHATAKAEIKAARKEGVNVLGVYYEGQSSSRMEKENIKDLFDGDVVFIKDVSDLPRVVGKGVTDMIKRRGY